MGKNFDLFLDPKRSDFLLSELLKMLLTSNDFILMDEFTNRKWVAAWVCAVAHHWLTFFDTFLLSDYGGLWH